MCLACCYYALHFGFGGLMTVYWFSDSAIGAVIRTVIGVVVGGRFRLSRVSSPMD